MIQKKISWKVFPAFSESFEEIWNANQKYNTAHKGFEFKRCLQKFLKKSDMTFCCENKYFSVEIDENEKYV